MSTMRSPRTVAGAIVLIAGIPLALAAGIFANAAEVAIHIVLGASFLLFASAAFDFRLPRWAEVGGAAGIGLLAIIFLLQAAADASHAPWLVDLAYAQLGQRLEKILGYVFLAWCGVLLVCDSTGWTRSLGFAVFALVVAAEIYSAAAGFLGLPTTEILKLLYLPLFLWLLFEGAKPVDLDRP
jgi:hypothetical protein